MYSEGDGDDAAKISGSGGSMGGLIFVPYGQADLSGSGSFSVTGRIIAYRVKVSGSDWTLGTAGSGRYVLVE